MPKLIQGANESDEDFRARYATENGIVREDDETDEAFAARVQAAMDAEAAAEPVVEPTPPTSDPRMTHKAMTQEEEEAAKANEPDAVVREERTEEEETRPDPEPEWQR